MHRFILNRTAIRLENIGSEDIVDKNLKLILGLIWTLILHYQILMLRTGGTPSSSVSVCYQ